MLNHILSLKERFAAYGALFLKDDPHVVGTLSVFLLVGLGLLIFGMRQRRILKEEGHFDQGLWERIRSLAFQHRLPDAIALCEASPGVFPRLYRLGLESLSFGQKAADALTRLREETQERFCRGLEALTFLSLLCPVLGLLTTASSLWQAIQRVPGAEAVLWARLVPALLPALAGFMVALLAGGLHAYFSSRLRHIGARMTACSLKLVEIQGQGPVLAAAEPARNRAPVPAAAPKTPDKPIPAARPPAPAEREKEKQAAPNPAPPRPRPEPVAVPAVTAASVWDSLPRL